MATEGKTIELTRTDGSMRIFQHAIFAVSFALLLWMSRAVLWWLTYIVFPEPREDMGHIWVVPLFSLAVVWMRRKELGVAVGRPSVLGLFGMLPGFLLFWIGTRGDQVRITQFGMFYLLWFSAYAVYGYKFAKLLIFPVVFLLFTVPLSFLDFFTVKLRFLTSALATSLLNGVGIPVVRIGTGIQCLSGEGFNLDVADPCSGLRSIFALTALTAAYAYMTQKTTLKKWLLFLCSVPIAVLGNLARIFSIALVANCCGQEAATGFYHDYSGYVVFLVGILLMMQVASLMSRSDKLKMKKERAADKTTGSQCHKDAEGQRDKASDAECTPTNGKWRLPSFCVALLVPLALFAIGMVLRNVPAPRMESADFVVSVLPPLPDYRAAYPWFCQNEHCGFTVETATADDNPGVCPKCGSPVDLASLGEKTVLPPDTGFRKCNYYDAMGEVFRIAVVINGASRQSIHRPEVCLPAQGFSMENGHIETFALDNGDTLPVRCVDLRPRNSSSSSRLGQGYFFVSAHERVASHQARMFVSIRDRVFSSKVTRWAMVTIFCEESLTSSPERREAVARFLSQFYPAVFSDNARSGAEREVK